MGLGNTMLMLGVKSPGGVEAVALSSLAMPVTTEAEIGAGVTAEAGIATNVTVEADYRVAEPHA